MSDLCMGGIGRKLMNSVLASVFTLVLGSVASADDYYTGEAIYNSRPKPNVPRLLGHIGPTGILAYIEKGVKVTIEGTRKGSPAEGKFNPREVILSVNGKSLKGLNPYVVLGEAITNAEAGNGKMAFELDSKAGKRSVEIAIPVLGAYGPNWPVDCAKSKTIVKNAAAYYHKSLLEKQGMGIPSALKCLFLLSTGDDKHLPVVKKRFQAFIDNKKGIGSHTWNNGYNGIACAEYYLRTGDKDVLPVLQSICDFARDCQFFDSGWKHWGEDINPAYVGGGLMNPAGAQVLTSLLLSKEAGVNVDEKTLQNALRYFYRFIGHGSIPYGDHRAEGGISSNGKNAMTSVAMQIASGATGDTSAYKSARDYLSMATLNGYPGLVMGHADNGRGDGIWRGISSYYLMDKQPKLYRATMDRLKWWVDLSRFDDGAIGMATIMTKAFNDPGSGAGAAMTYTAPLKTLRITGAPASKHAVAFKLPARVWGNDADIEFLSSKPVAGYEKYGTPLASHQITKLVGSSYRKGTSETDPKSVSSEQLNQFLRHSHYMFRAQAAKALRARGDLSVIEELLKSPDARLRRAALDGINDWRYFFATGKKQLATERFTPGMIESITGMLSNPKESTYVVEGALFAIGFMPPEVIQKNLDAIMPWTKHNDWWFRHASFMALQGMESDPKLYGTVLPTLVDMMVAENHTAPRAGMNRALSRALKKHGVDSAIGLVLSKGFQRGIVETQVLEGPRGREGRYNIIDTVGQVARWSPAAAPALADSLVRRGLSKLDDDELLGLVSGGRFFKGFLDLSKKTKGPARKTLTDTLYKSYRPEVAKRLKAGGGKDMKAIDALLALHQLGGNDVGWKAIGTPEFKKRTWHYTSFEPTAEKDILPKREGRRYRLVELPKELTGWYKSEFDASKWKSGPAPIGKGGHPRGPRTPVKYPSTWGDGEILLARTTFELESTDFDMFRLRTLCNNGFIIYLNGKKIRQYSWWSEQGDYRKWPIGGKLLKKGTNTLAVYGIAVYPSEIKPHWKNKVFGEVDCYIEGLNKEDLY